MDFHLILYIVYAGCNEMSACFDIYNLMLGYERILNGQHITLSTHVECLNLISCVQPYFGAKLLFSYCTMILLTFHTFNV